MRKLLLILPLIALTGVGCINVRTETADAGGIFATADAGVKWSVRNALPLPQGVSSIGNINIIGITYDPNDAEALYLATADSGLLVSYDDGDAWLRVKEEQLRGGRINAVAVDPNNKCVVYVAKGSNIMKTSDCNRTYDTQAFVETNGTAVTVVRVDWYNPNIVWLATASGDIVKSVDFGKSWTTVTRARSGIIDLMIDNSDSRIVLAATDKRGFWRTADGGATWTQSDAALEGFTDANRGHGLAQAADGSVIYYTNDYGLLRSRDHGATWEAITLLTKPGSTYIHSLAVNPKDSNNIFYGTATTLYSSIDGGTTWATRELPTQRAATAMSIDPNETSVLLVGAATIED